MSMRSFSDFDIRLGSRDSRKLQNNTYAQRRGPDAIAVRLHATDVLTFHRSGLVTFNTGGWETVTTKDRINSYAPHGWSVYSEKGRWMLHGTRADGVQDRWFFRDGITADTIKGGIKTRAPEIDGKPRVSRTKPKPAAIWAWHFIGAHGYTSHSGSVKVREGQTLTVKGEIAPCSRGLHASETPREAFSYHQGPILCRVRVWGDIKREGDKLAARFRHVVKMLDVSDIIAESLDADAFNAAIAARFGE